MKSKYYIVKTWKKYYLVDESFIKNFVIDNDFDEKKVWISNGFIELSDKDIEKKQYFLSKRNSYSYNIKKWNYFLLTMENKIVITFVKLEFVFIKHLKKLIKLYKTEKNTNIKKNKKISGELKNLVKSFILEDYIRGMKKFDWQDFIIIEESYKTIKKIMKKNMEIQKKIQPELLSFVDMKTQEHMLEEHYKLKKAFEKYDIVDETLQTIKNNYIQQDVVKYLYSNIKNILIDKTIICKDEQIIEMIKKWLKSYYSYYFDNNKDNEEDETEQEEIFDEKRIELHKDKKYNIIKNWFLSSYIFYVVKDKEKEWWEETKQLLNNQNIIKKALIIEELKENYKISADVIKKIVSQDITKYKNKEITKKEFDSEMLKLTKLLLEHHYYSKLYTLFNNSLHKKLLWKW